MKILKPAEADINGILGMIVDPGAVAKTSSTPTTDPSHFQATFIDDADAVVGMCTCDLKTASALGCALSLIPPGGAEAMVEDGELTSNAKANLDEVMNIFTRLLMDDSSTHLRLADVNSEIKDGLLEEAAQVTAFDLDLGKYGSGHVVFSTL